MPRTSKTALAELPSIHQELLKSFADGPRTAEVINAASLALKRC